MERKVNFKVSVIYDIYQFFLTDWAIFNQKCLLETHVSGTADNSPSGENETKSNNNDLALSLDNINRNMGKLANLLAKLCEKYKSLSLTSAHRA